MARPRKDEADRRTRIIQVRVSPREEASFLARAVAAGEEPADFARGQLCCRTKRPGVRASTKQDFELIDQIYRAGSELQRVRGILERTGAAPEHLEETCDKLEAVLDKVLAL